MTRDKDNKIRENSQENDYYSDKVSKTETKNEKDKIYGNILKEFEKTPLDKNYNNKL